MGIKLQALGVLTKGSCRTSLTPARLVHGKPCSRAAWTLSTLKPGPGLLSFSTTRTSFFGSVHPSLPTMDLEFLKWNSTKLQSYWHGILVLEARDETLCGQEDGRLRVLCFLSVPSFVKPEPLLCIIDWDWSVASCNMSISAKGIGSPFRIFIHKNLFKSFLLLDSNVIKM